MLKLALQIPAVVFLLSSRFGVKWHVSLKPTRFHVMGRRIKTHYCCCHHNKSTGSRVTQTCTHLLDNRLKSFGSACSGARLQSLDALLLRRVQMFVRAPWFLGWRRARAGCGVPFHEQVAFLALSSANNTLDFGVRVHDVAGGAQCLHPLCSGWLMLEPSVALLAACLRDLVRPLWGFSELLCAFESRWNKK